MGYNAETVAAIKNYLNTYGSETKPSTRSASQTRARQTITSKADASVRNTLPSEQAENLKKVLQQEQASPTPIRTTSAPTSARYPSGMAFAGQATPIKVTGSLVNTPTENGLSAEELYRYQSENAPGSRLVSDRATMAHTVNLLKSGMTKEEAREQLSKEGVDKNQISTLVNRASGYTRNPSLFIKNYGSSAESNIVPSQSKTWQREMAVLRNQMASRAGEIATEYDTLKGSYGNKYMGLEDTAKAGLLKSQFQSLQGQSDALGRMIGKDTYSMREYNTRVGGGLASLKAVSDERVQAANLKALIDSQKIIITDQNNRVVPPGQVGSTCGSGGGG